MDRELILSSLKQYSKQAMLASVTDEKEATFHIPLPKDIVQCALNYNSHSQLMKLSTFIQHTEDFEEEVEQLFLGKCSNIAELELLLDKCLAVYDCVPTGGNSSKTAALLKSTTDQFLELSSKMDTIITKLDESISSKSKYGMDDEMNDTLDVEGAAKLLRRSVSCIYTKCSKGQIPHQKDSGGRLVFSKKELMEWEKGSRKEYKPGL